MNLVGYLYCTVRSIGVLAAPTALLLSQDMCTSRCEVRVHGSLLTAP
jgi:hypothetical protein